MNDFTEYEMYSVPVSGMAYKECYYCSCRSCLYLRKYCKNCYLWEFRAFPRFRCMWYLPYVFRMPAYMEWFRELERIRGARYDVTDFKG